MRTCRPTFIARHEHAATTALARCTARRARWLPVAVSFGALMSGCPPGSSTPPPDSATAAPVTVVVATKTPNQAGPPEPDGTASPDNGIAALPPGAMAYLTVLMGSRFDWSTANRSKACIRYDAGRLEISGTVDLSALVGARR